MTRLMVGFSAHIWQHPTTTSSLCYCMYVVMFVARALCRGPACACCSRPHWQHVYTAALRFCFRQAKESPKQDTHRRWYGAAPRRRRERRLACSANPWWVGNAEISTEKCCVRSDRWSRPGMTYDYVHPCVRAFVFRDSSGIRELQALTAFLFVYLIRSSLRSSKLRMCTWRRPRRVPVRDDRSLRTYARARQRLLLASFHYQFGTRARVQKHGGFVKTWL